MVSKGRQPLRELSFETILTTTKFQKNVNSRNCLFSLGFSHVWSISCGFPKVFLHVTEGRNPDPEPGLGPSSSHGPNPHPESALGPDLEPATGFGPSPGPDSDPGFGPDPDPVLELGSGSHPDPGPDLGSLKISRKDARGPVSSLRVRIARVCAVGPCLWSVFHDFKFSTFLLYQRNLG